MPKMPRELDQFLKKAKRAKQAKDAIVRRLFPEYFVEAKLKHFEVMSEKERAYCETVENFLQRERENRISEINDSLLSNIKLQYEHDDLSRIVRAKFSTDPLCPIGSVRRPPGGRFNFGQTTRLASNYFQALYLANDFETALAETYHSKEESIGDFMHCKVSVKIDRYLDLRDKKVIKGFFDTIKTIKIPTEFVDLAVDLGVEPMSICKDDSEIYNAIFSERYKAWDTWVDQYSPSQWLGFYIYSLGIPAVIYPSVRDQRGFNLAIYPDNFKDTENLISLKTPEHFLEIKEERKSIHSDNYREIQESILGK